MRNLLLLLFLILVLFTGCAQQKLSPATKNAPQSSGKYLGPEPAKGPEIPVQLQTSPVEMLQLQTIPPKVVPTPQVAPPTPAVTPSPPPYNPDY
jgi:hypothetical protein